jgi:hypothetical protein
MTETNQNFALESSSKQLPRSENLNKLKSKKPLSAATKWMDGFDMFAASVPGFNFEGRKKVHSPIGVFLSLILSVMLCGIFALKFIVFITKVGPAIQINDIDDAWSQESHAVDIKADHFALAFQVVDYRT